LIDHHQPDLAHRGAAGGGIRRDPRQLARGRQADRLVQRERLPRQVLGRGDPVDQDQQQQSGQDGLQQERPQTGQRQDFG